LANRLSEDPKRSVLLLEAGPDYPQFDHLPDEIKFGFDTSMGVPSLRTLSGHPVSLLASKHNWQFVARATETAPPMPVPRGKVTGGSAAFDSSSVSPGATRKFFGWANGGDAPVGVGDRTAASATYLMRTVYSHRRRWP